MGDYINTDKAMLIIAGILLSVVMASALIALGTSMKLPLSTTYITFTERCLQNPTINSVLRFDG